MGKCSFCGKWVSQGILCPVCIRALEEWKREFRVCFLCGRLMGKEVSQELCPQCQEERPPFRLARAVGPYRGLLRDIILEFKYKGRRSLYRPLAYLLAQAVAAEPLFGEPQVVVPVPLARERLRERAFNQAELLAWEVGRLLGLKFFGDVLLKGRDTLSQAGLSRQARWLNLKDSFTVGATSIVTGQDVLLVDDVLTTGATAAACTTVLLQAGARSVCVVTLATGVF
ncbi:comF family protein [Thermanaeromonas toyohensis ToBE]|uniref:ComF family protein n=1 Tax=Thermanaeromonas toyohensis ToBE TaxID=698762 RepID=A0A1W1VE04_9FIRM|nr:ComF family protein [Thermanaeromonas toyohensis]SMB91443.1 comF family protein [Thermanaeromonas toyohensis ToBE]